MAAKLRRLSSRYLDHLLLSLRNQKKSLLPPSVPPTHSNSHHRHHHRKQPPSSSTAIASSSVAVSGDLPPLKLSHPLLRALESSSGDTSSPQFLQSLALLLVTGLAHHCLAAGRAIKPLSLSPSLASTHLAVSLFSLVDSPDPFLVNTILRSFLSHQRPDLALSFLRLEARPSLIPPNHFTFPLLAKLFSDLGLAREGKSFHNHAAKSGLEPDLFVRNAFIHMYCCFGDVGAAFKLFDSGYASDLVTWNSMLDGYVKNGMLGSARELFNEMPERDVISWNAIIAGHAGVGDMDAAKELFEMMVGRDVVSWNSMIDGYARVKNVGAAQDLFDKMPERSLISWNIMLALYARVKDYRECLRLFDGMTAVGDVKPNEATFVSVLTACAGLGELDRGKWVHYLIRDRYRCIESDVLLSTVLLTMYAKCGVMELAREVFDSMVERNVASWNSLIIGYGLHGQAGKALEVFMEMEKKGPRPNETTFVCILSSCAHGGMVLEGWWCFDRMIRFYNIEPKVEHFGCMMDLLGRAGLFKDSDNLMKGLSSKGSPALWGALLSASRNQCDRKLGEFVARKLIDMNPTDVGAYVLLSNLYATEGRWNDVEKVREMIKDNGLQKDAGASLVGADESNSHHVMEANILECKENMVFFLLSEMGARLKVPYWGHNRRQSTIRCTA
ncbi:pentatricopeptide repeat-containing protein At2g20540-like [Typha latifolia]|uniref:pentatricopeptide repeat-containing protein At2g20540-like n=1 Tax=Typha latifolia TaxID=4733 RepID=UPI003C306C28